MGISILNNEQIRNFYNDFTEYLIKDRIYPNARILQIFRFLDDIFKNHRLESALEIGCGIGIISERIRKFVPAVYAVDIGENNIRYASASVQKVNFVCGDFLETRFDQKFDLITLFDVLEHFPKARHRKVFEKIRDYSTPNTVVAVNLPDADFLDYYRRHFPEKLQIVDESIHFDEFLSHARSVNLEIIAYQRFGVDYENQYRYYLLNYRQDHFVLADKIPEKRSWLALFIGKIVRRLQIQMRKAKYRRLQQRIFS